MAQETTGPGQDTRVVHTVPVQGEPAHGAISTRGADLARTTIAVFFMVILAVAAVWILRPFVPAIVWAAMIVVALWPVMLKIQAQLGGKRWAAVMIMTVGLLLILVIPLSFAIMGVVAHTEDVGEWAQTLRQVRIPTAPAWVEEVPVAGKRIATAWNDVAKMPQEQLVEKLQPYARAAASWLIVKVGSVGMLIVQFLLTVLIAGIFFARGESTAAGLLGFFRRLAGVHGQNVVILAGNAIRSVAIGVVLTALIQSTLGGIGFAVAGVPFAVLLTVVMFVLGVAQIGPGPILFGAVAWMYWTSDSAWMPSALLVWCLFVGAIDNVLRPILIQRSGGDLPLLIVFAGVIGGLLSFGLVGIFLGPVVLAVVYTLLKAWVGGEAECDQSPLARPTPSP